ncbi:MAG: ABC transporter substrate-binding protein [Thermomicrobiales bacterium]|nr:ABC transporter substrate-binding protein [Thermomicrobiales bacterium]MCO5225248.1 ABC transporter substrate-binding protein [Thermomicrobiales bacterium]MCO5229028.1 ABC transporter substrate-binding protein [Thermomicrobiales bacterium]
MSVQYRPNRRDLFKHTAAAGVVAAGITHLSGLTASAQIPRNESLYVTGHQWGPPTTFSPLAATIAFPCNGNWAYLYEPLFTFNMLTGDIDPLIGESFEFDGTMSVSVKLNPAAKFHDGEAVTADDVVYTYQLPERVPEVPWAGSLNYISGVEKVDDTTVTMLLNQESINPGMVRSYLGSISILPQHVWEPREADGDVIAYAELEPVGSGPFKVNIANPEQIILERVDDWWGNELFGAPAPKYIVHPIPKSNDDANLSFQLGEIDLSQSFMPQIWKLWEDQGLPVATWFREQPYHLPGNIPVAIPNVHKPGLDNPLVRRAIAHGINYALLAETAVSNFSIPVNASLIVPGAAEDSYFNQEAVDATGWTYEPEKAIAILEDELGATKGDDGIYVLADGTRLGPWKASCPYGWTDWMTSLEVLAQGAKEIGIDITTEYPETPVFYDAMRAGNFDIVMNSFAGASAAGPWQRFRDAMDSRGVPGIGEGPAFWNFNRYQNADAEALLDQIAVAEEDAKLDLYTQIDEVFRTDVPVIPLQYRAWEFYNINETQWTGFPTSENPHTPPTFQGSGVRVFAKLSPVE